jgi:hypothetical protein
LALFLCAELAILEEQELEIGIRIAKKKIFNMGEWNVAYILLYM